MKKTRLFFRLCMTGVFVCTVLAAALAQAAEDEAEKARKLLMQFLAPNADCSALTHKLMPGRQDYMSYFGQGVSSRAKDFYAPYWENRQMLIRPRTGQTELKLMALDIAEHKAGKPLPAGFPADYEKLRGKLRGVKTVYAFKFVKPGESTGVGWDGLVRLGGHWVFIPLPWKALGE